MFILHKILRGDGAGLYLPYALNCLRGLERIYGNGIFTQKYRVPGFEIEIQQDPPYQYIRINASPGLYFEFLTNGLPLEMLTVSQGTLSFPAFKAAAVGVNVSDNGSTSAFIVRQEKVTPDKTIGEFNRHAQIGLIDEPMSFLARGYDVFETYAPIHPHTGIFSRQYSAGDSDGEYTWPRMRNTGYGRGMLSAFDTRDFGVDVPFEYNLNGGKVKDGYITNQADWPRANAIQEVSDPLFGSRRFGIMADGFSQFHVFPLSAIGPVDGYAQNVDTGSVQRIKPEIPGWAYVNGKRLLEIVNDEGTIGSFIKTPDLDWKFSPNGQKACLVVHERIPAIWDFDRFITQTNMLVPNDFLPFFGRRYSENDFNTWVGFGSTVDRRHGAVLVPSGNFDMWHTAPGLLEATITITITGSDPSNFHARVDLIEVRRPTTSPYCTLLAGYSGTEIKAADFTKENQHFKVRANDLCVLDVERWWDPVRAREVPTATTIVDGHATHVLLDEAAREPYRSFLTLKNLTRNVELRAFSGAAVIDYDFPTLSFALLERNDVWDYNSYNTWGVGAFEAYLGLRYVYIPPTGLPADFAYYDPYLGSVDGGTPWPFRAKTLTRHIAVSIFTLNEFREVLFPETMPEPIKLDMLAAVAVSPRDYLTNHVLVPLNDIESFSDLGKAYRLREDHFNFGLGVALLPPTDPRRDFSRIYYGFYRHAPGPDRHDYPLDFGIAQDLAIQLPWSRWCGPFGANEITIPPTPDPPSLAEHDWFTYAALCYAGHPRHHFYLTEPRFGWAIYADEIMNRLMCAPSSTFFAHPNGSWAFYSAQFIYNRNPMVIDGFAEEYSFITTDLGEYPGPPTPLPLPGATILNINTLAPFDITGLEHCLFDRCHFETRTTAADTTFVELYNAAVAKLPTTGGPNLKAVTQLDLRAKMEPFTTTIQTLGRWVGGPNPPVVHDADGRFPDVIFEVLDLKFTWQESHFYYRELGYFNVLTHGMEGGDFGSTPGDPDSAFNNTTGASVWSMNFGGHGLVDLTMGSVFTTLPGHSGDAKMPDVHIPHTHFSSCAMV